MAKKITAVVKLQLPAGKATPGPPVGSTLGPHGINIPGFTKEFNEKTAKQAGMIIPHDLRRPFVLVHHEDASRARSYQEGLRYRDGFGCSQ